MINLHTLSQWKGGQQMVPLSIIFWLYRTCCGGPRASMMMLMTAAKVAPSPTPSFAQPMYLQHEGTLTDHKIINEEIKNRKTMRGTLYRMSTTQILSTATSWSKQKANYYLSIIRIH